MLYFPKIVAVIEVFNDMLNGESPLHLELGIDPIPGPLEGFGRDIGTDDLELPVR